MIVYFDSSALVKLYVDEAESGEVVDLFNAAEARGTSVVSRVEVVSALSRSVAARVLTTDSATKAAKHSSRDLDSLIRVEVSDSLVARGSELAWKYRLRGYDALHLASALTWRDLLGDAITMATFDRDLWSAATEADLAVWPVRLGRRK